MGPYDNEKQEYIESPEIENGLWLEQDRNSNLFNENLPHLFIITTGPENEGPDHVKYIDGPHKGQYVMDTINEICRNQVNRLTAGRTYNDKVNPSQWDVDWALLGFVIVPDNLKRFNPHDGYYHA